MRQKGLTIITDILPGQKQQLRELLESIGTDIDNNSIIPFHRFYTVHFMRWVILDETAVRGRQIRAKLVLSTNYDGPIDSHLEDLCNHAGPGFYKIYSHCEDSPDNQDTSAMISYLKNHRHSLAAFYRGTAGRKVSQIRKEQKLWHAIQDILDKHTFSQNDSEIKDRLIRNLKKDKSFSCAFDRYSHELIYRFGTAILILYALIFLAIIVWLWTTFFKTLLIATLLIIFLVITWWIVLRKKERKDSTAFNAVRKDASRVAQLAKKEDYKVQNQLTHLVEVKPGITRSITIRFVLWAINLLATYRFNKGSLAGIQSIHYARWILLDGGRRLLFFSNYDGSWESYLGEFVDRAAVGLTAVWSNTMSFPPTKNLIREGARHSAEFKAWARKQQIPTQVWYSAYPNSSIKNINNNTAIRQGLVHAQNETEVAEFLQRL